jgi:hypothetical protein
LSLRLSSTAFLNSAVCWAGIVRSLKVFLLLLVILDGLCICDVQLRFDGRLKICRRWLSLFARGGHEFAQQESVLRGVSVTSSGGLASFVAESVHVFTSYIK